MTASHPIVAGVQFKSIEGFPGYAVGTDGSVWTCLKNNRHGVCHSWKSMKLDCKNSCCRVGLRLHKASVKKTVSHLVLEAFVGPRPGSFVACHFPDRDISNNRVENLRWDTYQSNEADKVVHGTRTMGSKHPLSKLKEDNIPEIFDLASQGMSISGIARRYKVTRYSIRVVLRREAWKHVPVPTK